MLSLVVIWSLFGVMSYSSYQDQWTRYTVFCKDIAALLQQEVARDIQVYDLSIKSASDDLNNPTIKALPLGLQRKVLFSQSTSAPGLGSILVIDKSGGLVLDSMGTASADLNVADREYFIAERSRMDQTLPFVSHPIKSRVSHLEGISFSQRRTAPDGSFDGVVVGMMTLDYFAQLFKIVKLPDGSSISLLHQDGTILMREPQVEGAIGRHLKPDATTHQMLTQSSGAIVQTSMLDGIDRMVVFKQVGALPISMVVGVPTSEFLRGWLGQTTLAGIGFLILSAIVVALGVMLARELDRRANAERTLADLAATDGLTQLANRRRFDEVLDIEWRRASRDGTSISMLMIDGDFFKAFNDTYGHVEGDEALRSIAGTLRHCVRRPADFVGRFGGEEFVVLLPQTNLQGAAEVARAIRQTMIAVNRPHVGSPFGRLTASIGVACRQPTSADTASQLVEAADAALYAAKAGGRDRIVVSPHGTLPDQAAMAA